MKTANKKKIEVPASGRQGPATPRRSCNGTPVKEGRMGKREEAKGKAPPKKRARVKSRKVSF